MRSIHQAIAFSALLLAPWLAARAAAVVVAYTTNDYPNPATNSVGGFCGANAIGNSLSFLQNRYPYSYGKSLVPTTPTAAVGGPGVPNTLIGMETLNATNNAPASNATVWNSKVNYINAVAPNSTTFAAMISRNNTTNGFVDQKDIQSATPTVAFLAQQLQEGEDVEIGFAGIIPGVNAPPQFGTNDNGVDGEYSDDTNAEEEADPANQSQNIDQDPAAATVEVNRAAVVRSFSHMVTLTGIDTDNMTLSFLDPNNPTRIFMSAYTIDPNTNYITFNWMNGGANNPVNGTYIWEAFAESPIPRPIPEPGSAGLLALALSALGGFLLRARPGARYATEG